MQKSERLFALDALRGLDMLLLCVVQPLVVTVAIAWGIDRETNAFMRQFAHYWGGFTVWDLVMPLFIFMCGAAVPFALPKRLDEKGRPTASFWTHVGGRVALLWILGMACQGRLLTCDPSRFVYFSNTLQAIAVGYVVAAGALLLRSRTVRMLLPYVLSGAYALLLHFGGDYSEQGNLATRVDAAVTGLIQSRGCGSGTCTWYLTSLMFGAMTLCGLQATQVLQSARTPWRKVGVLTLWGAALWSVGRILEALGIPCIKQIYTVSFAAQAMGLCILLLAALFVITDIGRWHRGWWIVTLYGQVSLAAYLLGQRFRDLPSVASQSALGGLAQRIGRPWGALLLEVGAVAALTFFLAVWRSARRRQPVDGFRRDA